MSPRVARYFCISHQLTGGRAEASAWKIRDSPEKSTHDEVCCLTPRDGSVAPTDGRRTRDDSPGAIYTRSRGFSLPLRSLAVSRDTGSRSTDRCDPRPLLPAFNSRRSIRSAIRSSTEKDIGLPRRDLGRRSRRIARAPGARSSSLC